MEHYRGRDNPGSTFVMDVLHSQLLCENKNKICRNLSIWNFKIYCYIKKSVIDKKKKKDIYTKMKPIS